MSYEILVKCSYQRKKILSKGDLYYTNVVHVGLAEIVLNAFWTQTERVFDQTEHVLDLTERVLDLTERVLDQTERVLGQTQCC